MELLLVEFVFSSSLELRITQKNDKIIRDFIEKYYQGFAFPCAEKDVSNVYYVYMFSAQKEIVGVTAIKISKALCLTHISLILITPVWRRRGLATSALKHVIKQYSMLKLGEDNNCARNISGGSRLTLSLTFEEPHLLQFYKKHGFEITHLDTASGLYIMTLQL